MNHLVTIIYTTILLVFSSGAYADLAQLRELLTGGCACVGIGTSKHSNLSAAEALAAGGVAGGFMYHHGGTPAAFGPWCQGRCNGHAMCPGVATINTLRNEQAAELANLTRHIGGAVVGWDTDQTGLVLRCHSWCTPGRPRPAVTSLYAS